jgi:hypothetical protein
MLYLHKTVKIFIEIIIIYALSTFCLKNFNLYMLKVFYKKLTKIFTKFCVQ